MDNETLVRLETKFEQLLEIVQDIKNSLNNQTEKITEIEKDVIILEQKNHENEARLNELKQNRKQNKAWLYTLSGSILSGLVIAIIKWLSGI